MNIALTNGKTLGSRTMAPQQKIKSQNIINTVKFLFDYQVISWFDKRNLPKWTKSKLIELGPTFVKIGQFVSTRTDIFDKNMIKELKTLQDATPPFDGLIARQIVFEELGCPINEVFAEFDDTPLASASISQVHRATLLTGEEVVIKVMRPQIKESFDRDFKTLKTILNVAGVLNERTISDSKVLLDECYQYLYEELSFENERKHLEFYYDMLKDITEIIVPKVYSEFSTDRIITMEYVPSKKITSKTSNKKEIMATILMECFIKQVVVHGIIHADPHPGNIGLTADGRMVLYDFGQVVTLDEMFVKSVKPLFYSVYERDVDAVTDILIKTKAIILTRPMEKRSIRDFVEKIIRYFENMDITEFQMSMLDGDLGIDLPFRINPKFIMLFRSLSLLEGICKELDPTFSYFKVIDILMNDLFFDIDFFDYKARKDVKLIFDVPTVQDQTQVIQEEIKESNRKNLTRIKQTMDESQKILLVFVVLSLFDTTNMPKSIALISAFLFLSFKIRK